MKKLVYLSLLILTCSFIIQNKASQSARPKYTPPGTKWVKDSSFVDIKDIDNSGWREFYYWVKRNSSKWHSKSVMPDSTVQLPDNLKGKPDYHTYYNNALYAKYPVLGISYEQAEVYSKWRSDRVNEFKYITEKHLNWVPDSNYNAPVVVKYSIPSKEEWDKSNSTQKGFKCTAVVFKQ